MPEDELDALEKSFAALSGLAFKREYEKHLAAGHSVVIASQGVILEVFPDGIRIPIGHYKLPAKVKLGARYVRRDI